MEYINEVLVWIIKCHTQLNLGEQNMSTEDQVRKASEKFYAALNSMANGDAGPLADSWSHSTAVTTMHPIGGREVGWAEVEGPWGQVGQLASGGQINLNDQLIHVSGDMAYEVGLEQGQFTLASEHVDIDHRVTNVYRRENGDWKIVHHHTDISPAMVGILTRLQAVA
jgi:ketosteroid isomerase-like protein